MPEFEFGEPSDEGPELFVMLRGERFAVFESFVLGERGVEFGLQEGEKLV